MGRYVAKNLKGRQTAWNIATQHRISATSSMLGDIKSIKMLGLQSVIRDRILSLRQYELSRALSVRWLMFWYNASGRINLLFCCWSWKRKHRLIRYAQPTQWGCLLQS